MTAETEPSASAITQISELKTHLIYGDIEEVPLNILGEDYPDIMEYQTMDREQKVRLAAAATVVAFSQGRLAKGGGLLVEETNNK